MSQQTILIVGTSFHTLRDYLEDHGFLYVTLKDVRLTKHPEIQLSRRIVCDFSTRETMLEAVEQVKSRYTISGVIATYENYILASAEIAAYLGVPGIPIEAAQACTDKFVMRQKFGLAPEKISPDYAIVTCEADVHAFAEAHQFPIILKPANLSKSLLVFKNHDLQELIANYQRMMNTIDDVYAKYAPHTTPKVIIEEFMEGPVHSVDVFVDSQGEPHVLEQVVDYQTGYEIGYNDNFHYSRLLPSGLQATDIKEVRHVAGLGCRALGMKNSPAHVEVILTAQGPRIVEIGARNGGYRERMHGIANGIDITGNALSLAVGEQPHITATRNDCMGVFELFPKTPGTFIGIKNEAGLRALPSLSYLSCKASPGSFVGKSSDGFKMCAVVMLHNADVEQFGKDLEFLNKQVAIQTKPEAA